MSITYAPLIPPVTDNRKLLSVAIKWTDNPGTPLNSVDNAAHATATNFKRLSNNQFNFTPLSFSIAVPFTHAKENVLKASEFAKGVLATKGYKQDGSLTYAMVNNGADTGSHSAGYTSYLLTALITTFYHEIGRDIPTNLDASGAMIDGKLVYQADGTSFMGHFASNELTACQLYGLGWLAPTQMAVYDPSMGTQEFTLYGLVGAIGTSKLMGVMINNVVPGKTLFLSRPLFNSGEFAKDPKIFYTLHTNVDPKYRGTVREAVFGTTSTYQGLTFTQVGADADSVTVQIAPST